MEGKAKDGVFTPIVKGAKVIVGEARINEIRGKAIKAHSEVMTSLIDTHDTEFGEATLKRLFDAADVDGNGTIDLEEMTLALNRLGFTWLDEAKTQKIVNKGDLNGDDVIDFEEFKKLAPMVLRQNLMKLAKQNGSDMGLLS